MHSIQMVFSQKKFVDDRPTHKHKLFSLHSEMNDIMHVLTHLSVSKRFHQLVTCTLYEVQIAVH